MSPVHRPCALVPTYDNPLTIAEVVTRIRRHLQDVVVVDDGSAAAGRAAIDELKRNGVAHVVRRPKNGGKGAAVKAGLHFAHDLGYTHALQIDADGQHTIEDIPRFLKVARDAPDALVLGAPCFDASAPAARLIGRKITQFWTNVETFGRVIEDPMCGFRVYPIKAAILANPWGNAMDFDPEVAVRMVWNGARVHNLETRVRYIAAADGGVSHFRMGRDNVLITWMHTRLVALAIVRLLTGAVVKVAAIRHRPLSLRGTPRRRLPP
jgi:glycosyltransferase involved in cell wall biosynthesis